MEFEEGGRFPLGGVTKGEIRKKKKQENPAEE